MALQLLFRKSWEASISATGSGVQSSSGCLITDSLLSVRESRDTWWAAASRRGGNGSRPQPPQRSPGPAEGCHPSVKLADGFSRGQSSVLAQEGQTVKLIICDEL